MVGKWIEKPPVARRPGLVERALHGHAAAVRPLIPRIRHVQVHLGRRPRPRRFLVSEC